MGDRHPHHPHAPRGRGPAPQRDGIPVVTDRNPMPQLRKDPITSRWVIVNVENPKTDFDANPVVKSSKTCPFCPGNEAMTPSEILSVPRKAPGKTSSAWQVRVV